MYFSSCLLLKLELLLNELRLRISTGPKDCEGVSQARVTEVPQESVNGTVGQSVLLHVTYSFPVSLRFPLPIQWRFSNTPNPLVTYTVNSCSVDAEGFPTRCAGNHFTLPAYQGRAVFFPENISLLLQNLQLSDSGIYSVTINGMRRREISLVVSTSQPTNSSTESDDPTEDDDPAIPVYPLEYIAGGFSIVLLLLLLAFCYSWCRGAAGSKATRITRQEQVRSPEDPCTEDALDLPSLYASPQRAREKSFTQSEPLIEYATLGFTGR
ncbi:uncharacterized protein LOC102451412 isoform X1 [Pelodiscus sinensis]|uniref:uncharacterized protein LOC102451412 isoform X1 n=1 Tax=Pelodiscus sinensis TaxID=13735 RepID=UPI003F6AB7B9